MMALESQPKEQTKNKQTYVNDTTMAVREYNEQRLLTIGPYWRDAQLLGSKKTKRV